MKNHRTIQLALQHHQAGRLAQAEALYHELIAHDPACVEALHGLGIIALQVGQHADAVDLMRRARERAPGNAAIHANLGEAYRNLRRLDDAVASFRRALELQPKLPFALNNLANALSALGRVDEAIASCRQAISLQPDFANAHNNLGICLARAGRVDEAIVCYRRAIALKPDLADGHNNLGSALIHHPLLDEAFACYQRALALRPDIAEVHANLGGVYKAQGRLDEALACYRQALALQPGNAEAHSDLIFILHHRFGDDAGIIGAELRNWNEQHARPLAKLIQPHGNDRSPDRRLRIGYLSPDFKSHPVGWFLRPLFSVQDHRLFEFFCYANVKRPDHITTELSSHADAWRDISGQTDHEVAALIREDRIDILVDLALHTDKNRLLVFAQKPAPVQATYLAYPGNSGLDTIDYRLTDPYLDAADCPRTTESEEPIRLPDTYWCYQPVINPPPGIVPLPALAAGHITFGCLNNFGKVTPVVLATWCRVLAAVPNAHLLLHTHAGSHRSRLQDLFARNGIDPQRLRFADRLPTAEYFQTYQLIDLALDSFPFPGGTTTCDALWMGVPVISLAGSTPLTRGGVSLLSNVGLPQLVAYSVDEYIEKAVALAGDLPRLAALRAGLRDRMQRSPLMDAPRFARSLEAAYRTMWHRWCAQQKTLSSG